MSAWRSLGSRAFQRSIGAFWRISRSIQRAANLRGPNLARMPNAAMSAQRSLSEVKWTQYAPSKVSDSDPGCVKTHTSEKCRKFLSPNRAQAAHPQHGLTPTMRNCFEIFYVRDERGSFHPAKPQSGHSRCLIWCATM